MMALRSRLALLTLALAPAGWACGADSTGDFSVSSGAKLQLNLLWGGSPDDTAEAASFSALVKLNNREDPATAFEGEASGTLTKGTEVLPLTRPNGIHFALANTTLPHGGPFELQVSIGSESAEGTVVDPMPWFDVSAPSTSAIQTAVNVTWAGTPGANCELEVRPASYRSDPSADNGVITIPGTVFTVAGSYSIEVHCAKTVALVEGVAYVTSGLRRSVTLAVE